MPTNVNRKWQRNLVASQTVTATGNSGALDWPSDIDSAVILMDVTAASGTSPTMDVAIQLTPDDGITFYTVSRFAQASAAFIRAKTFLTHQGDGTAAAVVAVADIGGVLEANIPFTNQIRILWTVGGTNPSFTFTLWAWGERKYSQY